MLLDGFHKLSSEGGGIDCDRDDLRFYHPYFQQDQPNLLKLIKRKVSKYLVSVLITNRLIIFWYFNNNTIVHLVSSYKYITNF